MNPKISIIVPVYNLAGYITKCVTSLTRQAYKNIEIIIVDDGSKDDTWSVLQKLQEKDDRIIVIHQGNGGTARARNTALEHVSGEFITFVDGDDTISNDALERNIQYFVADKELDWLSFSVIRVDANGNRLELSDLYPNFEIRESTVVYRNDFLKLFHEGRLSGLCCGTIYRWNSVKGIKFPNGEFYEDSFYFAETLWTTRKGMLSCNGQYNYLVRVASSQSAEMDRAHLLSTLHSAERKLLHFKQHFPHDKDVISAIEDSYYYYFKNFASKKVAGAKDIYAEYCKKFTVPHKRKWGYELKLLLYRIIGYNRIRWILGKLKVYD